jgi:hypothetical protein
MQDLPPLKAAVLLSRQLSQVTDDASRRCIVLMINDIRRSMGTVVNVDEPSKLGRRILKALGDQRLNGRNIARLCGLQYSGRFRGELKALVEQEKLKKVSGQYARKCPDNSNPEDIQNLIKQESA